MASAVGLEKHLRMLLIPFGEHRPKNTDPVLTHPPVIGLGGNRIHILKMVPGGKKGPGYCYFPETGLHCKRLSRPQRSSRALRVREGRQGKRIHLALIHTKICPLSRLLLHREEVSAHMAVRSYPPSPYLLRRQAYSPAQGNGVTEGSRTP